MWFPGLPRSVPTVSRRASGPGIPEHGQPRKGRAPCPGRAGGLPACGTRLPECSRDYPGASPRPHFPSVSGGEGSVTLVTSQQSALWAWTSDPPSSERGLRGRQLPFSEPLPEEGQAGVRPVGAEETLGLLSRPCWEAGHVPCHIQIWFLLSLPFPLMSLSRTRCRGYRGETRLRSLSTEHRPVGRRPRGQWAQQHQLNAH